MKNRIFIVGVMKGGTTVLHENLCKHPEVTSGKTKEIHYYSMYHHYGKEWYDDQFPESNSKYTIDASPTYFTGIRTNQIPELIKKDFPNAKIVVILRDPVKRAISHINHLQLINKIDALVDMDVNDFFDQDFKRVLTASNEKEWFLNQVIEGSNYYYPYQIYKNVIGPKNVLVLLNEDLKNFPIITMNKLFNFLELDPIELDLFKKVRHSHKPEKLVITPQTLTKLDSFLNQSYQQLLSELKIEPIAKEQPISVDQLRQQLIVTGRDKWLYLTGGSNKVVDQYLKDFAVPDCHIEEIKKGQDLRASKLKEIGVQYVSVIVPNKLSVYQEYINFDFDKEFSLIDRIEKKLSGEAYFLNLLTNYRKFKDNIDLFWKTDSHWTPFGCFFCYQLICQKLKVKPINLIHNRKYNEAELIMDLGHKTSPPTKENVRFYTMLIDSERIYANEIVQYKEEQELTNEVGLHVGSHVVYRNEKAENDLKVILFGDSFSEYRPHLLTGMLAETFKELHFIWNSNLDYEYIKKVKPDYVIYQAVERFLVKLPTDNFDIVSFAENKLKDFKEQQSK